MKVKIRHFQSIEKAELEIRGFTTITGSNNSGKSALVRAIYGLFSNLPGSSFVRTGEESSFVEVEFENGDSVTWRKGHKTRAAYSINGAAEINPGHKPPDEMNEFGVHPFKIGNKEYWPQFANQIDGQIFLLDDPGSVRAELVADVDKVRILNQALKLTQSDAKEASSAIKIRSKDLDQKTQHHKAFVGFSALREEKVRLSGLEEKMEKRKRVVRYLDKVSSSLRESKETLDLLSSVDSLKAPEHNVDIESLRWLSGVRIEAKEKAEILESLEGVDSLKTPPSPQLDLTQLHYLNQASKRIAGIQDFLSSTKALPSLPGGEPSIKRFLALGSLSKMIQSKLDERERLEQELNVAAEVMASIKQEIQDLLSEMDICPVCGSDGSHPLSH